MIFNFITTKKTFWLFLPHIFKTKGHLYRLLLALGIILLDIAAASLVPYFSKSVVDGLSFSLSQTLISGIVLLGFFWTLEKIAIHLQEIVFFPVVNLAIRDITEQVVRHIHQISMESYQKLSMPEIISAIKRISLASRSFIKIVFLMLIPTFIKLCLAVIVTFHFGYSGIYLVLGLLLSFIVLYKGTQWYAKVRFHSWNLSDRVSMRIHDSILNTKISRLYMNFEMNKLGILLNEEANLWFKTNNRLNIIHACMGLILGSTITFILYKTTVAIQAQTLTVGDFVLLKAQLIAAFLPFKNLSLEFRQLAESTIDIKKIIDILDIPSTEKNAMSLIKNNHNTDMKNNAICLSDLSFYYHSKYPLLQNISLNIRTGEKICIVGENGSGKSCLMQIIACLLSPCEGKVQVQHEKKLHFIPQDLRLLNLSLRDNLLYGAERSISDAELLEVLKKMGLNKQLGSEELDLDTTLGEMGIRLSGGEKQRIALCRALLLQPQILLLDETLNAIPQQEEDFILAELFTNISTIVMVTHRHSAFKWFDQCYRLEGGRLINAIPENQKSDSLINVISEKSKNCSTETRLDSLSVGLSNIL